MSRAKLTASSVATLRHDGRTRTAQRHYDGDGVGLCVSIRPEQTKAWVQAITIRGQRRWIGLGPYPLVSLKEARALARENKRIALAGGDPVAERDAKIGRPLVRDVVEDVIAARRGEWTNDKSEAQWRNSLANYAGALMARRIDTVSVRDVVALLTPVWSSRRETASRVRQRLDVVMEWAIAHGYRTDNPARAAGQLLPRRRAPVRHHRALPWRDVPAAVRTVRDSGAWIATRLAFEFLVLTAARSGEVRGATWGEIDVDAATWTIPASRMKVHAEHRVPLSDPALAVIDAARAMPRTIAHADCPLVFPSVRGRALSDATIGKLLREHGVAAVPHGFRSSFRDWAGEQTNTPHAVMEAALAHAIPSAVEAAYARSDLFEKRRALMDAWGRFVVGCVP